MAISTDPNVLAALATCYRCIPEGDKMDVLIAIFAEIAGLSGLTASELMELAKCYCGIPEGSEGGVALYLLDQIANGGGPTPGDCGNLEGAGDPT
jgi:hypothetical protein